MPKSSRHRSHKSRRHSADPSESSEEEFSRDSEAEKRKFSNNFDGNGELSGEMGKKRKERVEELSASDRWVSGEDADGKKSRRDDLQVERSEKSRALLSDSKYRSRGRYESSGEVSEDFKRRSESERERGSEKNKESGERERERGSEWERERKREWEKDGEIRKSSREKVEDLVGKNRGSKVADDDDNGDLRKDGKAYERQVDDLIPNSGMERGLEKHMRMQFESEDKWLGDGKDKNDKRALVRDDNRLRTYRDERYEEGKFRDPVDNLDRDKRQHGDKNHDRYSSERASGRSDRKYSRDENGHVDGHYRKSNIDDSDHYGSYVDDHEPKYKESREKKRSFEDDDDLGDLRSRSGRGLREEAEKRAVSNNKSEPHINYPRSDYRHSDKRDNIPRNSHWKTAATSSVSAGKERNRDPAKLSEFVSKESSSDERVISNAAYAGRGTATGVRERVTGAWQEKTRSSNDGDFGDIYSETAASTKYDRTPKSDSHTSPGWFEEKSPSKSMRRFSDRTGARHSLDADGGDKGSLKDGVQGELFVEKAIASEIVQNETHNRERTPMGSDFIRTGRSYGVSPGHLPPPSMKHGMDSASALGSFKDETGGPIGDRRPYSRNKRGGDHSFGWGQGNAWKGGGPSWPSPVANGFIPLPHGPPPAAFHPAIPHFPASPFFGVRPSMDLGQNGVPFHMHNIGDSFSNHGRQFGWHNTVDQTRPPHVQAWDGNNGPFRDESNIYGMPDWDPNRHLISNRGWAMGADMWKTQNKESGFPPRPAVDESLIGQPGQKSGHEIALPEAVGSKVSSDLLETIIETEATVPKKFPRPSKTSSEVYANFAVYYLSKIDISPDLADLELYSKCTSFCATSGTSNESSSAHGCIQNVDKRVTLKIGSKNQILGLPNLTAKDAVFEKATTLYNKQNEKLKYMPKILPAISLPEKKAPNDKNMQKGSGDEKMIETGDQETSPSVDLEVDSSDIMEAINISTDTIADNSTAVDHKSYSNSDAVISSSGFEASEILMEDCSADVNRIHS